MACRGSLDYGATVDSPAVEGDAPSIVARAGGEGTRQRRSDGIEPANSIAERVYLLQTRRVSPEVKRGGTKRGLGGGNAARRRERASTAACAVRPRTLVSTSRAS